MRSSPAACGGNGRDDGVSSSPVTADESGEDADDGAGRDPGTTERSTTSTEEAPNDLQRIIEDLEQTSEPFDRDTLSDSAEEALGAIMDQTLTESGLRTEAETYDYIMRMIGFLDQYQWVPWFTASGLNEPWVGVDVIQSGYIYTSNCNLGTEQKPIFTIDGTFPNAFYRPADYTQTDAGRVIFPAQTMTNMWSGQMFNRGAVQDPTRTGDYAAGMIVGHEFAHHIVDELATQWGVQQPTNPWIELISDCLAGTSTQYLFAYGYLEEGDYAEALAALELIGDSDVSTRSHGTYDQRQFAFNLGVQGTFTDANGTTYGNGTPGDAMNCINTYWRYD